MVAAGGLEPPRVAPTDFESVMSTNSITQPELYSETRVGLHKNRHVLADKGF